MTQINLDTLVKVTDIAAHITQVLAVLIGGGWAFQKYIRGRTFRHRVELSVTGSLFTLDDDHAIRAQVTLRNTGLSKITLHKTRRTVLAAKKPVPSKKSSKNTVFIDALTSGQWSPDAKVFWGTRPVAEVPSFEQQAWVEPGEIATDEVLVPVLADEDAGFVVAYRVRVEVRVPRRIRRLRGYYRWTASTILPAELAPISEAYSNSGNGAHG